MPDEKRRFKDKAEGRDAVFAVLKKSLIENHKPFITLSGDKNLRLEKQLSMICQAKRTGLSSLDFVQIYNHGIPFENVWAIKFKKGISMVEPAKVF
jgi:hypothetical protein